MIALAALLAALPAAPGQGAGAAGRTPSDARGAYRMQGTARVAASPLPAQTLELRADAVLSPGAGPRGIRARLAAQGQACELDGTLDPGGALAFEPGQRCALDLDGPDARGRVEVRLRRGSGRLDGRALTLDLGLDVSGAVSLRTSGAARVPGLDLEVPATWTPATPVRGTAHATASGTRDDSRAGSR